MRLGSFFLAAIIVAPLALAPGQAQELPFQHKVEVYREKDGEAM